uniref:NADH-ubiquinone oxidoreductase chain 2 n=1 Tax=Kolekanos plumicauda TaxID=3148229 RepID=A0A088FGH3_9SAUR|nr:NADH dehydrogenase subunit 2 [Kolekanos plumicaudus]AIM44934.1 NADH dehydrogenase subunit 2 [Kolekanos plumicaudus]
MAPLAWTMLTTSLSTSTIITMSSYHWLLAWAGLELNTLSILPLLSNPQHPRATEATMKYFIVQTAAATMILFAGTMNTWQTGNWTITQTMTNTTSTMMIMALMMKLGLTPLHFWYPDVVQGTTFINAMIISTWQKIAPLTLLCLIPTNSQTNMLLLMGTTSALVGGLMGLNQTQTRKMLAFSSIAHMGWLTITITLNQHLTTLTMMTYMAMTITMFYSLHTTKAKTLTDIGTNYHYSPTLLITITMTLMSMGGLPPMTGFMPKWLTLTEMLKLDLTTMSTMLVLTTLPSLFFYIRISYLSALTMPPNTTNSNHKWRLNTNLPTMTMPTIAVATLLLPITPLLYPTL